ncbi:MAG TPA: EAL domain-containing protein [Acidimicrobiia bacterium]|jgi:diguanylate cyclase (GGDEF)-like protein
MSQVGDASTGWWSRAAILVVPSTLTAIAFAVLRHFNADGNLPLALIIALLVIGTASGEFAGRYMTPDAHGWALHLAIAGEVLGVTAIIYAIGWGPTLTIGYVFILARLLDTTGSRFWRVTFAWTVVGIVLGQIAIALNMVPTYVPVPYVHGLAGLGILGMAFVMRLLATKTEENERALAARDRADADLHATMSLMSATLESTADGILVVDRDGKMTLSNRRFAEMWRMPGDIVKSGDDSRALAYATEQLVHPDTFAAKIAELYDQPDSESDDTLEFKDGRVFERHSRPQRVDGIIVGRVWSFHDVTERNQLLDQLSHQAFHDALTGLANRALLRDRLEHAIARSRRSASTVVVLFCDLDGFKMINDTLGHDHGDILLAEVAVRFRQSLREGDTAARLGGDEFAIVLDSSTRDDSIALAQRLIDTLREPFAIKGRDVFVRASIGIADNADEALDADELLCRADIAMYAAKGRGRDRYEIFQPSMQTELTARHELHGDLRRAIAAGELELHYQPLVDLPTSRIESFEALVRWRHPTRGLIQPDAFIPVAEDTGLIVDLGRFVLHEACRQIVEWRALPDAGDLCIGVNVSSHQLYEDSFVADVEAALAASGLPAPNLVLELTESALLTDSVHVQQRLAALKTLGVRIAIDDFGTGYSSLSYLRTFPIDFLKIDRTFVDELRADDDQGAVMVRSIISIGHNLRLDVIAEGIEDAEQLTALREAGCNTGQGFLFARPTPAADVPHMLATYRGAPAEIR